MKQCLLFVLLFCVFGCDSIQREAQATEDELSDSGIENEDDKNVLLTMPSELVPFVKTIYSEGCIHDTIRVNKIDLYDLRSIDVRIIDSMPFYDIPYQKTQISQFLNTNPSNEKRDADSTFSHVKQIWGYFYRDKNSKGMISDGMIEQWIFENPMSAQLAYFRLNIYIDDIYFNTTPFYCIKNNSIFIFHTRAMKFSFHQKPLYEKFLSGIKD